MLLSDKIQRISGVSTASRTILGTTTNWIIPIITANYQYQQLVHRYMNINSSLRLKLKYNIE